MPKSRNQELQEFRMQIETDTAVESTPSRIEIFFDWRPIYHHPRAGTPSHSATLELLQLLTS